MRFSIRLNNDFPLADVVALAQTAEAAGFDQFWISNDLFLRSASVMLGAVGRATTRIELGIGILNPYTIPLGERATIAATLDELTGCLASAPRRSSGPALDLREAKCSMPARLSGNQNGRIALWTETIHPVLPATQEHHYDRTTAAL